MAGIDKMYWTREQYDEFMNWYFKHFNIDPRAIEIFDSISTSDKFSDNIYAVTYFRERQDKYLRKHCLLPFVQKRLDEQYGKN